MTYQDPLDPNPTRRDPNRRIEVSTPMGMVLGSVAVLALLFGLAFYMNDGQMTNSASNITRGTPATSASTPPSTTGSGASTTGSGSTAR